MGQAEKAPPGASIGVLSIGGLPLVLPLSCPATLQADDTPFAPLLGVEGESQKPFLAVGVTAEFGYLERGV